MQVAEQLRERLGLVVDCMQTVSARPGLTAKFFAKIGKEEAVNFLFRNLEYIQVEQQEGAAPPVLKITEDQLEAFKEVVHESSRRDFLRTALVGGSMALAFGTLSYMVVRDNKMNADEIAGVKIALAASAAMFTAGHEDIIREYGSQLLKAIASLLRTEKDIHKYAFKTFDILEPAFQNMRKDVIKNRNPQPNL